MAIRLVLTLTRNQKWWKVIVMHCSVINTHTHTGFVCIRRKLCLLNRLSIVEFGEAAHREIKQAQTRGLTCLVCASNVSKANN